MNKDASTSTSLSDSGIQISSNKRQKFEEKDTKNAIIHSMTHEVGSFGIVVSNIIT